MATQQLRFGISADGRQLWQDLGDREIRYGAAELMADQGVGRPWSEAYTSKAMLSASVVCGLGSGWIGTTYVWLVGVYSAEEQSMTQGLRQQTRSIWVTTPITPSTAMPHPRSAHPLPPL